MLHVRSRPWVVSGGGNRGRAGAHTQTFHPKAPESMVRAPAAGRVARRLISHGRSDQAMRLAQGGGVGHVRNPIAKECKGTTGRKVHKRCTSLEHGSFQGSGQPCSCAYARMSWWPCSVASWITLLSHGQPCSCAYLRHSSSPS